MLIDIILVLLVIICFFLGKKRGFTLEFFEIFKYLLIIFLMNVSYPIVGKLFKMSIKNTRDMLKVYIITFFLLYISFSIIIQINKKFLKSIKLIKVDALFGALLGIIKSTFIIFIIYITVLIGASYSKRIRSEREQSFIIKGITDYGYIYTEMFPAFIKRDIENYRLKRKEEKIKETLLKEFQENSSEKGKKK